MACDLVEIGVDTEVAEILYSVSPEIFFQGEVFLAVGAVGIGHVYVACAPAQTAVGDFAVRRGEPIPKHLAVAEGRGRVLPRSPNCRGGRTRCGGEL